MNEFLGENKKDETESNRRVMEDKEYVKIKKAIEDYTNKEIERIRENARNKIKKIEEKMILDKEEKSQRIREDANVKIKRIDEDSKTEIERMKADMTKEEEKQIEIIKEYAEEELSKIEGRKQKEILKEKIREMKIMK